MLKKIFIRNYWSILILLLPLSTKAIEFKTINSQNGLSNRRVFNSACDNRGFMWFATRISIDRYNGENFTHYNFDKFNDNSKIKGVVNDKNGKIYAYTDNFFYYYDEGEDSFLRINIPDIKTSLLNTVYFDVNNSIWIGTTTEAFFSQDIKSWEKIKFQTKRMVNCFCEGLNGEMWIGTENGLIREKKTTLNSNSKPINCLNNINVRSLFYDKATNNLWIGTFSKGLFVSKNNNTSIKPVNVLLTSSPVKSLCKVSKDGIWAGTEGNGIFAFNSNNFNLEVHYDQNSTNENFIETNNIYHISCYKSVIWISTYTSGIINCNYAAVNHLFYTHHPDNKNSLINSHVNTIFEDSEGDIWFGTNSGISQFRVKTKKWKHYLTQNAKGESTVILALCEDANRNILTGGYATKLFSINKKTGIASPVQNDGTDLKKYIFSIITDTNGDVWYGGYVNYLTKYNPKTKIIKQFSIDGINKIYNYNSDTLLVATKTGLYIVNKLTEAISFKNFSATNFRNRKLKSFLNSIYVDKAHPQIIWMGTDGGGLYRFNLAKNKVKIYTTDNGLSSNYVYGILSDELNRLWVSTENGLNCFNMRDNYLSSNFELEGLTENVFNFRAFEKCKNGNMIWGTPKGALEITPSKIDDSNLPNINLKFTTFYISYEKVTTNTDKTPLKEPIDDTKELTLTNSQRSFSFDFIDLNYLPHSQTQYSWRLNGFDKDWSHPSLTHNAVYTNIPPGKYIFEIKAFKAGNRDTIIRTIEIQINHPFWATPIAYLIYLLLFSSLGFFILTYSKDKIEARNSKEKIRFFVNLAHDVRTPITLVKAPLNEIENENLTKDGRSALTLAQRNLDKLFNIITQLLDFQRLENDSMQLAVEETHTNVFFKSMIDDFILLAKEKNIELALIVPEKDNVVWLDRKKLLLIVENLLSNAIKYTNELGKIQLKIQRTENNLLIEVSDDGIGIPLKNQKNLFERFYRAENVSNSKETGSGIGLVLTKRLVTLHKGKISFISIERFGTTFKIEIPCTRDAYKSTEIITNHVVEDRKFDEAEKDKNANFYKILLVEDNDEIRAYLSKQLSHEYAVSEAPNGNEALEMIKNNNPDFILSDIMMPGMSGFELCSIVKNNLETSHIPLILLSSLSDRNDIIKGLNLGADDYITKPFDMKILATKIKGIIKTRNAFKNVYLDKTAQHDDFSTINQLDKVFIERVIELIEDNLSKEDFAINNLATDMAMSRSVFYKKLKSLTNENPKDFIKEIRMRKAGVLLRENKYQISEIAYLVGFSNPKHFSTFFKKFYGVSPSNYLKEESEED
ncbi:MAG: response regulator [Paludibacter sp.]|nr:response regulator [Paludibacter sp.]